MPLAAPPRFIGRITIKAGRNDRVGWNERDNLFNDYDLAITIPAGLYWPDALVASIVSAMSTESDINGLGQDHGGSGVLYSGDVSKETGKVTIVGLSSLPGSWSADFKLYIGAGQTQKLLTGGDSVANGERGFHHLGWNRKDSTFYGTTHTSDAAHSNAWYPNTTTMKDNHTPRESSASESVSLGGNVECYDFSGQENAAYSQVRVLEFMYLNASSQEQYTEEFWPWAKQGLPEGRFRLYKPRTSSSYQEYGLTQESLKDPRMERSTDGRILWGFSLKMRRYKP